MKIILKIWYFFEFLAFYTREMILANAMVAYDALTPTLHARPAIIAFRTQAKSDFELLILANLITMTPGTMTLDISTDHKTLYIHAMFAADPSKVCHDIATHFEPRVLRLCR